MQRSKSIRWLTMLLGLCISVFAHATLVQQMNLGELTINADKVFRGTVMRVENGTVAAGGGELSTVSYYIRVSETFKGNTASANGKAGNMVKVTMLGGSKDVVVNGNMRRFSAFTPPTLTPGNEYLLFTTQPSSLGLSVTVGVGQGAFSFVDGESVVNEAKNVGLFRDMDSSGMPQRGPIPYSAIAERIQSLVGNQGG